MKKKSKILTLIYKPGKFNERDCRKLKNATRLYSFRIGLIVLIGRIGLEIVNSMTAIF